MTGEMKSSRSRTGSKRSSGETYRSEYDLDYDCYHDELYDRVFDYQRVPSSMATIPRDVTPPKRPRSSSSSSSSSSALHRKRDRLQHRYRSRVRVSAAPPSSAKLRMEDLQSIKRELTVIKLQIDELLDSLDHMDRQRRDPSESSGALCSPYRGSAAGSPRSPSPRGQRARVRESPESGEASEDSSPQTANHSDCEYM
ncbi:RNA-binding Raly-like protein isoform X2 [Denticeps clupeoides]|nr:RNA-binding Raly-like protein isoform X2 [Denticeps clupeoides]